MKKQIKLKELIIESSIWMTITIIFRRLFIKEDIKTTIIYGICMILGIIIATIISYYIVNKKSFGPISREKLIVLLIIGLPIFILTSLSLYFIVNKIF